MAHNKEHTGKTIEIYNVGGGAWWTANKGYVPTNSGLNTQDGRRPGKAGEINIKEVPVEVWEDMQETAAEENAKRGTENVPNAPEGKGDPAQPQDRFLGGLEDFFNRFDPAAVGTAVGTAITGGAAAFAASQLPNLLGQGVQRVAGGFNPLTTFGGAQPKPYILQQEDRGGGRGGDPTETLRTQFSPDPLTLSNPGVSDRRAQSFDTRKQQTSSESRPPRTAPLTSNRFSALKRRFAPSPTSRGGGRPRII